MVCHAVTVQNQGGENKVGILLRIIFGKGSVLSDAWFVKYAKSQHPENLLTLYCPLHRCGSCWYPPCFSSSSHSASPSLSTLTKLRVSFSVLAKRSFSGVFLPKTFAMVFPRYDVTDFYATPGPTGLGFKGPLWSPFRAMYNLTTWNMFISVPLFYRAIFKFRRGQELTPGDNMYIL